MQVKVLEHAVDFVLYFEGNTHLSHYPLRKNRFGSTHEIAIFKMGGKGLIPVANLHSFCCRSARKQPRFVVVPYMEGPPLLVEVQALAANPHGTPPADYRS